MSPRPPLGFSDLILAIGRLAPDADIARRIVRLLRLADPAESVAEIQPSSATPTRQEEPVIGPGPMASRRITHAASAGEEAGDEMAVDIEVVERTHTTTAPSWLGTRLAPPGSAPIAEASLELEPLLRPAVTRNILSAALRTWHADGRVDTRALVERMALLRPIRDLPRRLRPTLRHGAHVIVDRSGGMSLFARDVTHLVDSIERVAGDRVRIQWFDTNPLVAGEGPRRTWQPWDLVRGIPVIAISDVAIGSRQPATDPTAKWLDLAARARRAEAPLIAFVPWSADRWPAPLTREMRFVEWDRGTTVGFDCPARPARQIVHDHARYSPEPSGGA